MISMLSFKNIQLALGLLYLFPLIANASNLTEGEDYNYGNGKGAPIAEIVACYAHKDEALDHFSERRVKAIQKLCSDLGGEEKDLASDLKKMLKANYDQLSMDMAYASGDGEKIKFLTCSGLEKCQVFLINKKFYHYDECAALVLYSSTNIVLDGFTGDIIVMDIQGNIFIHPKEMGYIHHSSFFSQKPIAFGAMVRIKHGEIVKSDFTNDEMDLVTLFPQRARGTDYPRGLFYYSGHYDPHSGSAQIKDKIKKEALDNFKKELNAIHFELKNEGVSNENCNHEGLGTYLLGVALFMKANVGVGISVAVPVLSISSFLPLTYGVVGFYLMHRSMVNWQKEENGTLRKA